jgi:ketosteroid isomerase-like protein
MSRRSRPWPPSFIGAERIVWGSDYPHHDATFPGAVDAIRATVAPCPTALQAQVLGRNARRLYGLPSHLQGPAAVVHDYFSAVTAQDVDSLRTLFAPSATLVIDTTRVEGIDSILDYYERHTFTFADFRPDPGPLEREGNRVTVPIALHMGGQDRRVRDVFETDGTHIISLHVTGFSEALGAARPT